MAAMKLRHIAALAVVACFLLPSSLRAADAPIAVPGTADVAGTWYLVAAPWYGPPCCSQWIKTKTFSTEDECKKAQTSDALRQYVRMKRQQPGWQIPFCAPMNGMGIKPCRVTATKEPHVQCIPSDDPRLKENSPGPVEPF